ncbi:LysR family transcriptional regulator [Aneurinibacillus migulanus]|uniref:LysR family transcriptional regulator n=1 Tax=Aneurinibacillus migulanus TaxID=47500 RepID=UPI0005BD5C4C|nr:LysR family transcriptional regulator [Aneurinibacillus migulanus]KIV53276.1 LysR family transcriptional regulator [Aneurinibacillus migulanus]KPD07334.1 LysR family transcriptional regulator [Aneurinibacillus migulanus]CEH30818.1 LysR family transcriptional regulator [Aneurinibacillus migulanus]
MDERDWTMLHALYEAKNITKTAEKLCISQPALTYRLQRLEKEFGVTLVYTGRKGVEFTAQGEHLVRYSEDMLLQLRKTKEYLLNMEGKVRGTLRLGVSSMFAGYKLPSILKNFHNEYPDVDFNVTTGWSAEVINSVYKHDVHVGIVRGDYNWPEEKHLLMEEPLFVVSDREISLKDLPNLPRINYNTDTSLKLLIEDWWKEMYSQPPSITMEVDKMETCKKMTLNGLGYAILPGILLDENEKLFKINLTSKSGIPILRRTWIIYRKKSLEVSVVKAFVDFLKRIK